MNILKSVAGFLLVLMSSSLCGCEDAHNEHQNGPRIHTIQGVSNYLYDELTDDATCVKYFATGVNGGLVLTLRVDANGKPLIDSRCLEMKAKAKEVNSNEQK